MARRAAALWLAVALTALGAPSPSAQAQAGDRNAEARVFFERGNRLLERAMRRRGRARRELLEDALREYVSALRIVRSRNVLFNAAVVLEQLGRHDEAFAYWTEYLAVPGLSEQERAEATRRRDALREKVAIVAVEGEPAGARVHVDRLDLAPVGTLPLEVAVQPGEHVVYVSKEGYERAERRVRARRGERRVVQVQLAARPVELLVEAPGAGRLLVDGEPAVAGRPLELPPGEHRVRFEPAGGGPAIERTIRLRAGQAPRRLQLRPSAAPLGALRIEADAAARIHVDGELLGEGRTLRLELPAGPHRVRIEGEEGRRWEGRVVLRPGSERRLRAQGLEAPGLPASFWVLGGMSVATVLGGAVVGSIAVGTRGQYESQAKACGGQPAGGTCWDEARKLANRTDQLNLVADVLFGAGLLAGAAAAWIFFGHDGAERPVQVAAMPLPGGAGFALRLRGGAL